MVYVIGEVVVVLSESDERVEGNPVWQNRSIFGLPLYYRALLKGGKQEQEKIHQTWEPPFSRALYIMRTWVLDVSAVAADGRRPRRVEEKATNSKSGKRQT